MRYSLENPHAYVDANLAAFLNILEGCRHGKVRHLTFASSSSVYGANTKMPFSVHDNVDHPFSLYAATKKANELMAHSYSHLYGMPTTGLGSSPCTDPGDAPTWRCSCSRRRSSRTARSTSSTTATCAATSPTSTTSPRRSSASPITRRSPIPPGTEQRPIPGTSKAPYRIYNIGNHTPVPLMDLISCIEKAIGKEAKKNFLPMQAGDVPATFADVEDLVRDVGFQPSTPIEDGVRRFVAWYRDYYRV